MSRHINSQKQQAERLGELHFKSRPEGLSRVREFVRASIIEKTGSGELLNQLVLAVDEACSNVIRHAYGPDVCGDMVLEVLYADNELIFRLTDFAESVDRSCIKPKQQEPIQPGGLGVQLMRQVMDKVCFVDSDKATGNVLEMKRSLTSG